MIINYERNILSVKVFLNICRDPDACRIAGKLPAIAGRFQGKINHVCEKHFKKTSLV